MQSNLRSPASIGTVKKVYNDVVYLYAIENVSHV